jgi:hypothetical protein
LRLLTRSSTSWFLLLVICIISTFAFIFWNYSCIKPLICNSSVHLLHL